MSDLAAQVSQLSTLLHRLSLSVDLLSLRVSELETRSSVVDTWEVIEAESSLQGGLTTHRLEEGPPPIPASLLALAHPLSEIGGGREARAKAAFEAGFWAAIALLTETPYTPSDNPALTFCHWVVLRGAGVQSPYRVVRKSDLNRLVRNQSAIGVAAASASPVEQGFASFCEVKIFCGGVGCPVPPLLRWRSI